jgi:hypothetical protein
MSALAETLGTSMSPRQQRAVARRVEAAQVPGQVAAAKIASATFAAHVSLQGAAAVASLEAIYAEQLPHAADRLAAIGNTHASICVAELARLAG